MTRLQLITQTLRIVGDPDLTTEAADWLNNVLYEMETSGYLKFLAKETTYQTENTVYNVAFSAAKWPSAAITDYSKGMRLWSDEPKKLVRISKAAFDKGYDASTGNPSHFAIWNDKVYLWPTPVTNSLPLLTAQYYQEITVPTADGDDIETVVGILPKWQRYLINGMVSEGFDYMEDARYENRRGLWERNLALILRDNEDFVTSSEAQWDKPSIAARQQGTPGGGA